MARATYEHVCGAHGIDMNSVVYTVGVNTNEATEESAQAWREQPTSMCVCEALGLDMNSVDCMSQIERGK